MEPTFPNQLRYWKRAKELAKLTVLFVTLAAGAPGVTGVISTETYRVNKLIGGQTVY